jgi:putative Holliday junction resolvase
MALPNGRRVAIDFGTVRVGIAATDPTGRFTSPRAAVAPEVLLAELGQWVEEIAIIYVGIPRHLSGSEGVSASLARSMALQIKDELGVPVRLLDERLTTKSAQERKRREAALQNSDLDSVAALELLDFALQGEASSGGAFGEEV